MEKFKIRYYSKKELALLFFNSSPHTAVNHLMSWIRRNKSLSARLTELGYVKTQKGFPPLQVKAIIDHLGTPEDYD